MSFVLGITGHSGVGKSTALSFLASQGFFTIDADEVVENLYQNEAVALMKKEFGAEFITDGIVNKVKLREFLIEDPEKIQVLNRLIHPLVNGRVLELIEGKDLVAIEAVYFEKGLLLDLVDKLILLKSHLAVRTPFSDFLRDFYDQNQDTFDYVVNNDAELTHLENALVEILAKLDYKA